MFKRFRSSRIVAEPPPAPTAEEILADLETFVVQSQPITTKKNSDDSMDQWWQEFEQFAEGHKNLTVLEKQIGNSKDNLKEHKKELEAKTAIMKKEIELQKAQIADVCS